tara:strand:+ start:80 stop:262 length:183 start_codon:yes stop_codon:yes gene_type:complete
LAGPELYEKKGNEFFAIENFAEALDYYTKAIEELGEHARETDYCNRANAYIELDRLDEAI